MTESNMKDTSDRADERVLTEPRERPPGVRWTIERDDDKGWEAVLRPTSLRGSAIAGAAIWNGIGIYGLLLLWKERPFSYLGFGISLLVALSGLWFAYYVIASLLSRTHFRIDGSTVSIRGWPFLPSGARLRYPPSEIARFEAVVHEVSTEDGGERFYLRLVLVPKTGANVVVLELDSKEEVEFLAASLNEALEQVRPAPDPLETRGPFR